MGLWFHTRCMDFKALEKQLLQNIHTQRLHLCIVLQNNVKQRKYTMGDHFFTARFADTLKPFCCTLSKTPWSQSLNCCLFLFTQPEALCLLKTCLFTSRAQQVSEQSARWNCSSHLWCEAHLLKMLLVSQQNTLHFQVAMLNFPSSISKECWQRERHEMSKR